MKAVGNYNNVSKKLLDEIPVLKPGQEVVFEMLHGVKNPDPDPEEKRKNPVLFGKKQIPTVDRIFDPYANDGKGGYVDIIVADGWINNEPIRPKMFVPGFGAQQFHGKFSLFGGKIDDMEMYEFLMLTNTNQDNKHRDKSVHPLFRVIDTAKQVSNVNNKMDILREALNIASSIEKENNEKALLILRSLNKPINEDMSKNLLVVKDIAMKDPEFFIELYKSPRTEKKAFLKEAIELGVLVHQAATGKVSFNNNAITVVNKGADSDVLNSLLDWFDTAPNGADVMESVKKKVEKLKKKQLEPAEV